MQKQILCGQRFDGLVDSIRSQITKSFTNFVSYVLKNVVNDYALTTLSKTSTNDFESMLNLIDCLSFEPSNNRGDDMYNQKQNITIQAITDYSYIPLTPLFHLFNQRIETYANELKMNYLSRHTQSTDKNEEIDSNGGRKAITTADNDNNFSDNAYTTDTFRNELYRKIIFSDEILKTIIEEGSTDLIDLYRQDLVRTFCTITEKSKDDLEKCSETIKYVSKWLQLFDERDQIEFETIKNKRNEDIWLLCHVYTSFIYERNDLLSLYIACRTLDRLCLEPKNIYNNNNHHRTTLDRSEFREQIFIEMFNALWKNLCDICSSQIINYTAWIQIYSFVSRYYPSEKICDQSQLRYMRSKLELMQIAYILFLNGTIPTSNELIQILMNENYFPSNSYYYSINQLLDLINNYFNIKNCSAEVKNTFMTDIQQWIIVILKNNKQKDDIQCQIENLFKYLIYSDRQIRSSVKQCFFNQLYHVKVIENYNLPYHPFLTENYERQDDNATIIMNLYFFYIKDILNDKTMTCAFIHKIHEFKVNILPNSIKQIKILQDLHQLIKNYLVIYCSALFLCDDNYGDNTEQWRRLLKNILTNYAPLQTEQHEHLFNNELQLFLSTIIIRQN
ncbi:unnamed protein product [Didymodactylos carnosus]|uniref:Uncharacterized protein n=1 Tax=Didymodactylos carnosus TaxID=1234261 RepID=A0A814TSS4_9BILA|nr:unnamed protein product [Didymodactylos carnosus]CAF3929022.1 unnamed protein product [Didymodactylos carnosus]